MKGQNATLPLSGPHWSWPLPLDQYDRVTDLTVSEQETLSSLFICSEPVVYLRKHTSTYLTLQRLLDPINDTFIYLQVDETSYFRARRVLLLEMQQRNKAFWGWTIEEWCEIITPNRAAFARRYGGDAAHDGRLQLVALAYLLCPHLPIAPLLSGIQCFSLSRNVFGEAAIREAVQRLKTILQSWGYQQQYQVDLLGCVSYLFLYNRSPYLEELSREVLEEAARTCPLHSNTQHAWFRLSRALAGLGCIKQTLPSSNTLNLKVATEEGIAEEWLGWCKRWLEHSPLQARTRRGRYYQLLKVGRWLKLIHPEITSPAQWTSELAAEFVAAVQQMKVGEWVSPGYEAFVTDEHLGQPLVPTVRIGLLSAMQRLLGDCQEWGWISSRLNVVRALRPPRSLQNLVGPNPRVVDRQLWAKLLWAAMNLERADLPLPGSSNEQPAYPVELVRALAMVWCFSALRSDEIRRLRMGCIRWQTPPVTNTPTEVNSPSDAVCFLDVPVNKTSTAYTKPVHPLVGKRIAEWEQVRPAEQPRTLDFKTGEAVEFLFCYRGKLISSDYINGALIPLLCHKAGIPLEDSRGKITSHRARATIASMLYNAKEPLSIFELKEYLGHKHLSSTQQYVKVDATKMATQLARAGYLEQNMATIEVLLDQEAVRSGRASRGEVWKYYDLGHGYCTHDFWAECKHRMACARCPFYCPKESLRDQLVEGQANLVRMLEFVKLTEEEKQLVEEGVGLHQTLLEHLQDVPTPGGLTPREMATQHQEEKQVIAIEKIQLNKSKRPLETTRTEAKKRP